LALDDPGNGQVNMQSQGFLTLKRSLKFVFFALATTLLGSIRVETIAGKQKGARDSGVISSSLVEDNGEGEVKEDAEGVGRGP